VAIQAWSTKTEDWQELEAIEDYEEYLDRALDQHLAREPESFRRNGYTEPNTPARRAEVKILVC